MLGQFKCQPAGTCQKLGVKDVAGMQNVLEIVTNNVRYHPKELQYFTQTSEEDLIAFTVEMRNELWVFFGRGFPK